MGAAELGPAGRGVSIAVVDSGSHPGHPHLRPIAGAVAFATDGRPADDPSDRLGHGTAVAAAIQEKAPEAELWVVKVFHEALATSVTALVRAIDWSSERGIRLVNLSLGTANTARADVLGPAVERARERGTIVVAAYEHEGIRWLPGSLDGALGVCLDWSCPRDRLRIRPRPEGTILAASGYPRPVPGVPRERNLKGISFAVANATGLLAATLEAHPDARDAATALETVRAAGVAGEGPSGGGGTDGSSGQSGRMRRTLRRP